MDHTIPDRLSPLRSHIEKRCETDQTFKDVYNDYLIYRDAHWYWSHNTTDEAPVRCREYAQLVSELEKELIHLLKKGANEAP